MGTIQLPSGEGVPRLGLGTWCIGDDPDRRAEEIAALQYGVDLGMSLIDTAEMYGEGKSEELVGEAIAGRRDRVFLVSKVYPHNATRKGVVAACERSLRRLATDRLDLYLLHWRGNVPLAETVEGFESLRSSGKIRHWGVSNFDTRDMDDLFAVAGGEAVQTNQVLYNLTRRGIESSLLPWQRSRRIPVMAYSPIEQAKLACDSKLAAFAQSLSLTPAQVALAWTLRQPDVVAIPKTSRRDRVGENHKALEIELTRDQLTELDRLFPPPHGPTPLEML